MQYLSCPDPSVTLQPWLPLGLIDIRNHSPKCLSAFLLLLFVLSKSPFLLLHTWLIPTYSLGIFREPFSEFSGRTGSPSQCSHSTLFIYINWIIKRLSVYLFVSTLVWRLLSAHRCVSLSLALGLVPSSSYILTNVSWTPMPWPLGKPSQKNLMPSLLTPNITSINGPIQKDHRVRVILSVHRPSTRQSTQ